MLKINLICIGKLKEKYFIDACSEYEKRLTSYAKVSIIEIDEYKLPKNPKDADINMCVLNEGTRILSKLNESTANVAMCIEGHEYDSVLFSEVISNYMISGVSEINFIIGGSFGLSDNVKSKCKLRLSLSKMTLPHMLTRVILLEQIYRAFQIMSGGKYHK